MKKNLFGMLIILMSLYSCQSQPADKSTPENANSNGAAASGIESPKGKYSIKSGIVVYKTTMMGMDAKQILTFDDYGQKEIYDVLMEMMGVTVHTVTLTKDGYTYTLDLTNKTGTKSPANPMNNVNIDFQNLSDDMVKKMNLKKDGNEEFLGKTCDNMTIDYQEMGMKGNFLVYKGIALKIDVMVGTMKMLLAGESFEENPVIPAGKFDIPADITISGN